MREILFKAKRIDNGKWVQGYLFIIWERVYILWGTTNDVPNMIEVDSNTICQYTGLTDKNGNKIWENDIVSFVHSKFTQELLADTLGFPRFEIVEYKRNYVIEFVNTFCSYGLRFRNKSIHFPCKCSTVVMHDVEVIGNIFDNADLVKE